MICLEAFIDSPFCEDDAIYLTNEIRNWDDIHQFCMEHIQTISYLDEYWKDKIYRKQINLNLKKEPQFYIGEDGFDHRLGPYIYTYFGTIEINFSTLCITPFDCRYYRLYDYPLGSIIRQLVRLIAKKLNKSKVLYVPDSALDTEVISCKSYETCDGLEEVIAFAEQKFGLPPRKLSESVDYGYFIDYI